MADIKPTDPIIITYRLFHQPDGSMVKKPIFGRVWDGDNLRVKGTLIFDEEEYSKLRGHS